MKRRHLLHGLVAGVPIFAGCSALSGQGNTNQTNNTTTTTATTTVGTDTPEQSSAETDTTETDSTETDQGGSSSSTDILYTSMIPVPSDPSNFSFEFYQLDVLRKRERESSDFLPGSTDETATYPGPGGFEIPYSEIDTLLLAEWDVVVGPFEKEPIITTIKQGEANADLRETYKGYDIYVESDDAAATAISDDTLISGLYPDPSLSGIKATIDAMNGDGERFYDVNDNFQTLVDALGTGLFTSLQLSPDSETELVQGDAGIGAVVSNDGGTPVFTLAVLFEDASAVNADAVRDLLVKEPSFRALADPEDVTVEETGRVVTFTGEITPERTPTTPAATTLPVTTTTRTPGVTTTPATATTRTTTPSATTSGNRLVLSPLVTYTNPIYGYQIDYPKSWTVNDSFPQEVKIFNPDGDGIRITTAEGQFASFTLEEIVNVALTNTRQVTSTLKVSDRREITLDSGQSAVVLDITYDVPTDTTGSLRSYLLITKQGNMAYQVEFVADATDWTPTVERKAQRIVESFTLTSGTTALARTFAFVHGRSRPTVR